MQRFFLLWHDTVGRYYAEGLIHVDGSVYVRGFYMYEVGKLFKDIDALKEYLSNLDYVTFYDVFMIDEVK